jgi:hypothetical protein
MANLPPSHSIAHSSAAPGPPIAALTVSEDQDKATAEQLVLDIYNPKLRERALRELYMVSASPHFLTLSRQPRR